MMNMILGFLAGLLLSSVVWAAGPPLIPYGQSGSGSRPDRQWEQDRGGSVRDYLQQRQQDSVHEQRESELRQEIDRLKRQPC